MADAKARGQFVWHDLVTAAAEAAIQLLQALQRLPQGTAGRWRCLWEVHSIVLEKSLLAYGFFGKFWITKVTAQEVPAPLP